MESFFHKIELLLELLIEVEILHEDCGGVTKIRHSQDGEFTVYSWTEFTVQPEEAETAFREHLLPTKNWMLSPYTKRCAREAIQRRLEELKELDIEL